jgi:hypothetical protein
VRREVETEAVEEDSEPADSVCSLRERASDATSLLLDIVKILLVMLPGTEYSVDAAWNILADLTSG